MDTGYSDSARSVRRLVGMIIALSFRSREDESWVTRYMILRETTAAAAEGWFSFLESLLVSRRVVYEIGKSRAISLKLL